MEIGLLKSKKKKHYSIQNANERTKYTNAKIAGSHDTQSNMCLTIDERLRRRRTTAAGVEVRCRGRPYRTLPTGLVELRQRSRHDRWLAECPRERAEYQTVEWPARKPDCNDGRRSLADRYDITQPATRRFRSFDRTGKLKIDWYELTSAASRPGFFTIGVLHS